VASEVRSAPRRRYPVVHVQGSSAIRRPLLVLAVCAVLAILYVGRDFLIPTAGAVVLALILTPVANTFERLRLPPTAAAGGSVLALSLGMAALLAISIPALASWLDQGPLLTYTMEKKLEGLRKSLAVVQEVTKQVEQATQAASAPTQAGPPPEKVVVKDGGSLLTQLATNTPGVLLQVGYAGVLAFMLLAHRNTHRRQVLRVPASFYTRVRLARVMRDINERVGQYLFALCVVYSCVAAIAAAALWLLGFPNAIVWGALMGIASFVPFLGPVVMVTVVALVALLTFDDWARIVAAPASLLAIHLVESQFITPMFLSRLCALNTVAVFTSIALLGWMWGAIGAIVAVPLLILLSTIAAHLPALRWLEVLLADPSPARGRMAGKPSLASVAPLAFKPIGPMRQRTRATRRFAAAK
jgi:predicted PurR-regulated permease PerM